MRNLIFASLLAILVLLSGCGGGGSKSSSGPTGGGTGTPGNLAVFLTDSLDANYDHVWVKVKRITAYRGDGEEPVLYENPDGYAVDLKTLRDESGQRFVYLASSEIPSTIYLGLKVVVDREAVLFTKGAQTGTPANFEGAAEDGKEMDLSFAVPRVLGNGQSVAIDFDLANWDHAGGVVSAPNGQYLKVADMEGTAITRQDPRDHVGIAQQVAGNANARTFILRKGNSNLNVVMNADTIVFHALGYQSPVITDGQLLEVTGVFDQDRNVLVASVIRLHEQSAPPVKVRGIVSDSTFETASLELTESVEGMVPTDKRITVTTRVLTNFFSEQGVNLGYFEYFARLADVQGVEVEGEYLPETNELLAWNIRLVGDSVAENWYEAEGAAQDVDPAGMTFKMPASEWDGLNLDPETLITVIVEPDAYCRWNDMGEEATAAQFMTALANGRRVEIEGLFDRSTMTMRAQMVRWESEEEDSDDFGFDDDGARMSNHGRHSDGFLARVAPNGRRRK